MKVIEGPFTFRYHTIHRDDNRLPPWIIEKNGSAIALLHEVFCAVHFHAPNPTNGRIDLPGQIKAFVWVEDVRTLALIVPASVPEKKAFKYMLWHGFGKAVPPYRHAKNCA